MKSNEVRSQRLIRAHRAGFLALLLSCIPALCLASDADLLERLNAPDYETREAASAALLADETLTEARLLAMCKQATSPEQRHRLLDVAKHHTLRLIRQADFPDDINASLGVSHDVRNNRNSPGRDQGAVRVVLTIPGFPAHSRLRTDDLIVAINDEPLPVDVSQEQFANAIRAFKPGDKATLTIVRGKETFEAPVIFGSAIALEKMYSPASVSLTFNYAERWRQARQRFIEAMPQPEKIAVEANPKDGDTPTQD